MADDVDQELETGLANTTESWKRGLLAAAHDARRARRAAVSRERWILRIAAATLVVSLAGFLVALLK